MRGPSALDSCMMIRWSCGFRAEKVMNSRTWSLALVTSSTPRSPAVRSLHRLVQQGEERVDRGPPELLLRAEVVVQEGLCHPG